MPRTSKDIAKRLRFDHRPRRDAFRRLYLPVGAAVCAAAVGLWVGFGRTVGSRQYSPGPVSPARFQASSARVVWFIPLVWNCIRSCSRLQFHTRNGTMRTTVSICIVPLAVRSDLVQLVDRRFPELCRA